MNFTYRILCLIGCAVVLPDMGYSFTDCGDNYIMVTTGSAACTASRQGAILDSGKCTCLYSADSARIDKACAEYLKFVQDPEKDNVCTEILNPDQYKSALPADIISNATCNAFCLTKPESIENGKITGICCKPKPAPESESGDGSGSGGGISSGGESEPGDGLGGGSNSGY